MQGGRWESTLVEPTGQRHAAPANAVPRRRAATGAAGAVAGRCGRELGNIDTGRRHHMAAMALQCFPTTCHIRGCRLPHTPAFKERAQVPTARPPVALQSQEDEAMWWEEVAQFPGWLCCHLPPAAFFCSSAIWQGAWSSLTHGACNGPFIATRDLARRLNSMSSWVSSNKMG